MNYKALIFTLSIFIISFKLQAQRINDYNNIGWITTTGTFQLSPNWSLHSEYQFRRDNFITNWQQSLLRTGINYKINQNALVRAGYVWIETFNYGDFPINSFGKQFTEHRTYQTIILTQQTGRFELSHRYKLEQRWLAVYNTAALKEPSNWVFLNRLRFMARVQTALKGKLIADKTPYAALYDEIFIGFGKNVNQNIFDQNRLGILLGYKFNKHFRVEGGYFNQILQLPRRVNNLNVIQYNTGFIVNSFWNIGY
ncbi:MAG: DUF2490 domain-containing protein [Bacteroidia bacterium]